MKLLLSILFLFCFFSTSNHSQVVPEWVTTYSGIGSPVSLDYTRAIAVDLMGNIYVTGESYGAAGNIDFLTVKINSSGDTLWTRSYNGTGNGMDEATDIGVDLVGNVFVTGRSMGATTGWDYVTIKYNTLGVLEWISTYNGFAGVSQGQDVPRSICVDDMGNSYVTGNSNVWTGNLDDILTVKYNSSGVEEWVNRYNGPLSVSDQAYSIKVDDLGNVYVAGYVDANSSSGTRDFCTIKYNSAGVQQWIGRYNGPDSKVDEARALSIDPFGNVFVTGYSESTSNGVDYATVKYNSSGVQQWASRFTYTNSSETAADIVADSSGNCYVTGTSKNNLNWYGCLTIKYNPLGDTLWVKNERPTNFEGGSVIVIDNSKNVYISGLSYNDLYTIKYDSSGTKIWEDMYRRLSNSQQFIADIAVEPATGILYVAGSFMYSVQNADYLILKYASVTGVENEKGFTLSSYLLNQNYPNPFNPSTKIKYTIASETISGVEGSRVQLKVFDVLGNEVATLVDENKSVGSYEVELNASELTSGVYFYKLQAGSYSETKKMILMK